MEALATAKFIRLSPRKARLVADLIRGKSVDEAMGILALTPKKASPIIQKVMLAAAANVKFKNEGANKAMNNKTIFIKEIRIDEGPTMKRIRPRAQGRAFRILKRTSHVKVIVEG